LDVRSAIMMPPPALVTLVAALLVVQTHGAALASTDGTMVILGSKVIVKVTTSTALASDETITLIAQGSFRFKANVAQTTAALTSVSTTAAGTTTAKSGANTCGTDTLGTTMTFTAKEAIAIGALIIECTSAVLDADTVPGVYSFMADSTAADTITAAAFDVPVYASSTAKIAVGIPSREGSMVKDTAAGNMVIKFGVIDAHAAASTVTITASEAIFTASQAAAAAVMGTITEGTAATNLADATTTLATSSSGKVAVLTLGTGKPFAGNKVISLQIVAATLAKNPLTVGMVTVTVTSSVTSAGGSNQYPVFNAADTPLLLSATPGTKVKSTAPGTLALTVVLSANLAANKWVKFTPTTAIFGVSKTPACAMGPQGQPSLVADCTSASDSDGKVLTVTTANVATNIIYALVPYVITISDELATNTATLGTSTTFTAAAEVGDTTASSASTAGYRIFNAATTAEWVSGIANSLTGSASTSLTVKFYPQATVVGGATAGKVTVTASHAIFAASAAVSGITCQSVINRYTSAVPCSAASDSTGKILTVTATTAGYDFTTSEEAQIALTSNTTNPNNATVTFSIATGVDTTTLASQTGYQSTYVAPPPTPPTPTSASASGGNGTTGTTPTGTSSTVASTITFSGYTYAASTATTNFGNLVSCAFARCISDAASRATPLCTATTGPTFTYVSGASSTNTVAAVARRAGSTVATSLKIYETTLSKSLAESAGVTAFSTMATLNAQIGLMNTAAGTGFSAADMTAASMTPPAWTTSSAAVVLPSMMAMFSAVLLVLMQ